MTKVNIDELEFYDLRGNRVAISHYFQNYALLVFLRHLA
jgi:hypothetical protein